jgi:8-oxo-dGTP diphosphatase
MREPIRKLEERAETTVTKPVRLVVAALILRGTVDDGAAGEGTSGVEVLICQRKADQPMSLKWEFPGGKIEAGESSEDALARELDEELGIKAVIGRRVARIRHKYRNGGAIDLQFFVVREFDGALENRIFNDVRWAPLTELPGYDFLAADLGLIRDLSEGKLL